MWIVRLTEQRMPYGPFDDEQEAHRFADYLTAEVDPAEVERLCSPISELLAWRDHVKDPGARPNWCGGPAWSPDDEANYREKRSSQPSVRGGPHIGHAAEHDYREEQRDRD